MKSEGVVVLTTARLLLRTFRADDLQAYAALNADPEVVRYLGGPQTRQGSDEIAEWANEHYDQDRVGLLALERLEDRQFIGMCGVHVTDWYPDDLEIGWRLARPYWGNGYVTEAARAWLDYAFDVMDRPRVISVTEPGNLRSVAVMHRLGLRFDHAAELPDEDTGAPFHAVVHTIAADGWRQVVDGPAHRPRTCDCLAGSAASS